LKAILAEKAISPGEEFTYPNFRQLPDIFFVTKSFSFFGGGFGPAVSY
jgi:hypothetical protein